MCNRPRWRLQVVGRIVRCFRLLVKKIPFSQRLNDYRSDDQRRPVANSEAQQLANQNILLAERRLAPSRRRPRREFPIYPLQALLYTGFAYVRTARLAAIPPELSSDSCL